MFVGRENVLEEIKTRFQGVGQCHERVALVGLAGVGFAVPERKLFESQTNVTAC
jgi:hypothetical protein